MGKEKIETTQEKKEKFEEIQRLELDPEQGVDIVIRRIPGESNLVRECGAIRRTRYFPAQVVLERDGKIIEDFQDEASNIKFYFREREMKGKEYEVWGCPKDSLHITMPRKWESAKDLFIFAHEIGHRFREVKHPEDLEQKKKLSEEEEKVLLDFLSIKERNKAWRREKPGEAPELVLITEKDKELLVNKFKDISQKMFSLEAKIEREAWAEGLNLIRKLKREKGIDLLRPFRGKTPEETRKNLEEYIHGFYLSSYEWEVRKDIEELGLNEELKGIFTKKYNEEFDLKKITKEIYKGIFNKI